MRKKPIVTLVLIAIVLLSSCGVADRVTYPATSKSDQADNYFGTRVPDPYRWLEDVKSAETAKWVEAQNAVAFGYLGKIPYREALRNRLTELYTYPRFSSPMWSGENYFFAVSDGRQNQAVLYVQKGLQGAPEVFLDANQLSPDGTVRIGLIGFSLNKKYVAISRGTRGSEWSEIRVMDIATKKELPDRIQWVKFSNAGWYGDGLFYSGYDKPALNENLSTKAQVQKIFYHKLGDPQEKDQLVYEDKKNTSRFFEVATSENEEFAFLAASEGAYGTELYFKDLRKKSAPFELLIKGFDGSSTPLDIVGDKFLVYTNLDAPNFKVVLIDPKKPAKENWQTVIPQKSMALSWANVAGGQLFCGYLKDAHSKVYQFSLDGKLVREVGFPMLGTADRFSGWKDDAALLYTFTSFTLPPTIYKYDIAGGRSEVFRKTEVKFTPEDFEVEQVFYESKDKTKVPMFIVHKKGLVLDGKNPCYLTGYGGFDIGIQPIFNSALIPLIENGCVFAEPNLRGGPEYGEAWHRAGMLEKKQNVFDDFIAAAEYLIKEGYTSTKRLAIAGGVNGGLLVGAAMTQRPDLFRVALPASGVLDMLRFHKFTEGGGWTDEYGSSASPKDFKFLYAYSPLHHIKPEIEYPATLVTTAGDDARVSPAHSYKYIAALQENQRGYNPVLIRVDSGAGAGSNDVARAIAETADRYTFFLYNVGVKVATK
jgi:prolyl oligopeptidase